MLEEALEVLVQVGDVNQPTDQPASRGINRLLSNLTMSFETMYHLNTIGSSIVHGLVVRHATDLEFVSM